MKKEYTFIVYIGAIGAVILLSWIFREYTISIPFPLPFGSAFVALLLFSNLLYELFRGASPQVITNVGHYSINTTKDIKRVPWYTESMTEGERKNKTLGDMAIFFPGGVESWGLSVKSTADYPVYIFPAIYTEKEGSSYRITANLMRYEFNELPRYVRYVLMGYRGRIKDYTPIYYGITSHLDGSATPENLKIIIKERSDDKHAAELETKLKTLYKELRRDSEKRSKTYYVREGGEVEK